MTNVREAILSSGELSEYGWSSIFGANEGSIMRGDSEVKLEKRGRKYMLKFEVLAMNEEAERICPIKKTDVIEPPPGLEAPDEMVVDEEKREAKLLKAPVIPAADVVARHNATHFPFEAWCAECVGGRGVDDPDNTGTKFQFQFQAQGWL